MDKSIVSHFLTHGVDGELTHQRWDTLNAGLRCTSHLHIRTAATSKYTPAHLTL